MERSEDAKVAADETMNSGCGRAKLRKAGWAKPRMQGDFGRGGRWHGADAFYVLFSCSSFALPLFVSLGSLASVLVPSSPRTRRGVFLDGSPITLSSDKITKYSPFSWFAFACASLVSPFLMLYGISRRGSLAWVAQAGSEADLNEKRCCKAVRPTLLLWGTYSGANRSPPFLSPLSLMLDAARVGRVCIWRSRERTPQTCMSDKNFPSRRTGVPEN